MGIGKTTLSLTGTGVSKGRVTRSCVGGGLQEQLLSVLLTCDKGTWRALCLPTFKLMCVSMGTLFERARQGLWAELRGGDFWAIASYPLL